MSIWDETLNMSKLNVDTLLQVWLALNFDMELKKEILENMNDSNFKNVVGEYAYSGYLQKANKPMRHSCKKIEAHVKKRPIQNIEFTKIVAINNEWYYQSLKNILDDEPSINS